MNAGIEPSLVSISREASAGADRRERSHERGEERGPDATPLRELRSPGGATGDWQVRTYDCIRAHHPMLDRGQMHRSALATHESIVATHQLTQDLFHRHATSQRMSVTPVGAEGQITGLHGCSRASGNGFLSER